MKSLHNFLPWGTRLQISGLALHLLGSIMTMFTGVHGHFMEGTKIAIFSLFSSLICFTVNVIPTWLGEANYTEDVVSSC